MENLLRALDAKKGFVGEPKGVFGAVFCEKGFYCSEDCSVNGVGGRGGDGEGAYGRRGGGAGKENLVKLLKGKGRSCARIRDETK